MILMVWRKLSFCFPCVAVKVRLQKTPTYAEARELQSQSVHAFAAGEAACWVFSGRQKRWFPKKIGCDIGQQEFN